jgi:hypothetical protein
MTPERTDFCELVSALRLAEENLCQQHYDEIERFRRQDIKFVQSGSRFSLTVRVFQGFGRLSGFPTVCDTGKYAS